MSRPIKFRAWEIKIRQWNNDYKILLNGTIKDFDWDDDGYFEFEVPKEEYIIEQYTGLKDKNDKEIYEGDIVSCGDRYPANTINFSDGRFWLGDSVTDLFEANLRYDIDIIGNIHENPELLGGEE